MSVLVTRPVVIIIIIRQYASPLKRMADVPSKGRGKENCDNTSRYLFLKTYNIIINIFIRHENANLLDE